ncbi:hypothetical protein ACJMK2_030927 [Sinanodonta woodiana]|uniref:Uncharacterized protein n=1 Tax=Sinanodonta woodiana TaxID=1069815 RepID=A0ABD3WYZ5_SINWO
MILYFQVRRGRIDIAGYDLDTFDLPVGIHLPRYHEQDPNKEYSPPSYDCIYHVPKEHSHSVDFEQSSCHQADDTSCHQADDTSCHQADDTSCHQADDTSLHQADDTSCHQADATPSTVENGCECNYRRINPNCYQVTVDIVWI